MDTPHNTHSKHNDARCNCHRAGRSTDWPATTLCGGGAASVLGGSEQPGAGQAGTRSGALLPAANVV